MVIIAAELLQYITYSTGVLSKRDESSTQELATLAIRPFDTN